MPLPSEPGGVEAASHATRGTGGSSSGFPMRIASNPLESTATLRPGSTLARSDTTQNGRGARGYALKSDPYPELVAALRHVQQHKSFFTGRLAMTMVESFANEQREGEPSTDHPLPGCPLTARSLEIAQLLATRKSAKKSQRWSASPPAP